MEWVAIPFSRRPSQPRDWIWVSCIADIFFTIWATREALMIGDLKKKKIYIYICPLLKGKDYSLDSFCVTWGYNTSNGRISAILDGSLGLSSRFKLDLSLRLHFPTFGQLVLSWRGHWHTQFWQHNVLQACGETNAFAATFCTFVFALMVFLIHRLWWRV